MSKLLAEGTWADEIPWKLYESTQMPNWNDCTNVICITEHTDGIVLSKTKKRGEWEVPGGHIEKGEPIEECLKREIYEESGVILETWKYIGYLEAWNGTSAGINPSTGKPYPEIAYSACYLGYSSLERGNPTCPDIVATRVIQKNEPFDEILDDDLSVALLRMCFPT